MKILTAPGLFSFYGLAIPEKACYDIYKGAIACIVYYQNAILGLLYLKILFCPFNFIFEKWYAVMEINYAEIGRNIREHRCRRGMKQKELAERINVSDQHISHIENGHTKLSLVTLVAICNVLEVDCNTLLGASLTGARRNALQNRLIEAITSMETGELRLLSDFCEMLTNYDVTPL